ncbi:hypothetical protein [Arthrobacter sp.]|uniref:hypothetical protein n=1 Tax=Arthrobacter sp. TaxID=1667 RepID=UPI002811281D|nr:hypothetical protein [Arthrobacter sp.]
MRLTDIQADGRPIAVARIGLGIATVFNAAEMSTLLTEIAGGKLAMPVHTLIPPPTVPAASAYLLLAVLAGIALTIGWRTASAAVVSTLLNVLVFLWDQQTYSSHRFLATSSWRIWSSHDPMPHGQFRGTGALFRGGHSCS